MSGAVKADLDADGVRDAGQVAVITSDDRGLKADCGGHHDGVDDVSGAGGRTGQAGGPAHALVVGENVAGLEDLGDLVLRAAAPGLGQHDNRDDRADARGSQLVVQGQEVGIAPLGGDKGPGVIDDGGHYPAACCRSSSISPDSIRNCRARCREAAGSGPCSVSYSATSSRAAARPAACRAAAWAFSVAASASQVDTGLPSFAAAALIVSSTSAGTEIESFRTVMSQ